MGSRKIKEPKDSVPRGALLFVTDPWTTLDHPNDTSLRLIEVAIALKRPAYWCDVRSVRLEEGRVRLDTRQVHGVGPARGANDFEMERARVSEPAEFARLLYRTDPPVDLAYLQPVQLLALGLRQSPRSHSQLVNPAEALFFANEKLETALLGSLMPASCVSSQLTVLERFGRAEGRAVLKPLHEAQSHGVELLDWGNPEGARAATEQLRRATQGERMPVLLQRYLEGIHQGEQRLWFLDGKLLAHARKRPKQGEFKIDMDQGGTLVASTLSAKERAAALKIGAALRARKIRLAAVDLIDGYITDYNITSPGLIVQMERVTGLPLAEKIVRAL